MNNQLQQPVNKEHLRVPLFDLYQVVRDLDQQLGHQSVDLQSYFLLIETMMKGYMILSRDQLLLLCEKLWLKPHHRQNNILNKAVLATLLDQKLQSYLLTSDNSEPKRLTGATNNSGSSFNESQRRDAIKKDNETPPPSALDLAMSGVEGELKLYIAETETDEKSGIQGNQDYSSSFLPKVFLTKGMYLPVNSRRLEQSIRSFRFPIKGRRKTEIDMDATIAKIARTNFFNHFEYSYDEQFKSDWTMLIDNSDSMAAFQSLGDEMIRIVTEGKKINADKIFFFRNLPSNHIFFDRSQSKSFSWRDFIEGDKKNILIFSDAGAARGNYHEERIIATIRMLQKLNRHRVAWLNPMPQHRWKGTSAEMIAEFTGMFEPGEGDKDGLTNIVRLFKSKIRQIKKI